MRGAWEVMARRGGRKRGREVRKRVAVLLDSNAYIA